MDINNDNYYSHPAVSNSTLTAIKKLLYGSLPIDSRAAFAFGTLIDGMLTEPDRVDFQRLRVWTSATDFLQYSPADFALARKMADNFKADPLCSVIWNTSEKQKISFNPKFRCNYLGFEFTLPMRGKWDFFGRKIGIGADFKSTGAESQDEFEDSVHKFDYDRQAAVYMDIENDPIDRFIFLGVSKKNQKIFKVPVIRGTGLYFSGRSKLDELAFKYHSYFQNFNFSNQ